MRAFSINAATYRDARFKTKEYKEWHLELQNRICDSDIYKDLLDLASDFKAEGGTFEVTLCVVYPFHVYYNKSKQISAKTFDVTNTEKLLVDVLFGDIMEVNDRYITKCTSSKRAGAMHEIEISIELSTDI